MTGGRVTSFEVPVELPLDVPAQTTPRAERHDRVRVQAPGPPATTDDWWLRTVVWWHVMFVGVVAVVAVIFTLEGAPPQAYALLALLLGWYFATGARALPVNDARLGTTYLAVAVPAFAVLVLLEDDSALLLFVFYPQMFALYDRLRVAVGAVVGLVTLFTLAVIVREGWTREATLQAGVNGAINLTFALLIGLFVNAVISESSRRADLIEELRTTRGELDAAQHERGALAERERLSREIHDTLAQGFTSILMLARATRVVLPDDPVAAVERVGLIETTAQENLAEARSLVAALAPVDLQGTTLVEALARLGERFARELGITVEVSHDGAARALPTAHEVVLLRAAQEALSNVRKHAGAGRAWIRVGYGAGTVLEVRDDGRGFDPRADGGSGFGIPGMRARVEEVGGRLVVSSSPGSGTSVSARLP